jgi:hypothetical protein
MRLLVHFLKAGQLHYKYEQEYTTRQAAIDMAVDTYRTYGGDAIQVYADGVLVYPRP